MSFFVHCHNQKIKDVQTKPLSPEGVYTERILVYGKCEVCKHLRAKLYEYDSIKGQWIEDRNKPKRIKNMQDWIETLEQEDNFSGYDGRKIKQGTKSAMAYIFGKSKKTPLGTIHLGYDWNGTKRYEELVPSLR